MKAYETYSGGPGYVLHVFRHTGSIHRIDVLQVVTSTHPDDLVLVEQVFPVTNEQAEQLIESAKTTRWWE